ncbi:similar to An09g01620 [Aspergillus luchuensis IFO 4308]|nr:similar to An09g01620 [Aspergillus luchuensis IFO 4308]
MDTNAGTACSVLGPPEFPNHRSDSRHDEPRRQPAGFLFVDYQDQASHGSTLAKKKQAFIKKVYHQSPTFPIEQYGGSSSFDRALRPAGIDPFASLCVPAKTSVDFYFDHYRTECSWSIYPFGATGVSVWWWQQSIEQPALLYIILATSASHRAGRGLIAQAPKAARDSYRDSLEYRQKTLTGLQSMMQIPGTSTSLLRSMAVIIAHMICVEAADTNLEAVDGHVRWMIKIVHLVGGLDTFSDVDAPIIYSANFMRAAARGSAPPLPITMAWKARVLESLYSLTATDDVLHASSIGFRFFNSPWSQAILPSLRSIIKLFRKTSHYMCNTGPVEEAPVLNDWLVYTAQQLLLIAPVCMPSNLQECLRLSVLLFAAVQVWGFQGLLFLNQPVLAFHCRLETALLSIQRMAPDLAFWMLFTGGIAAMGHYSRGWFVDRLASVAGQLCLTTWDSARTLMNLDIVPNWLRIILLILSIASFLPQLQRIWQQFTLLFFLLVNQTENVDVIHKTTGDWINLAQLCAVWILWVSLFSLGLYYPSDQHSRGRKVSALLLYIVHLLVSVVPVVADAIDYYLVSTGEDAAYRNFGLDIFGGYHYGFIHPAMTLVGIYAWFPQNDEIHRQTQLHSLSETGLAAQAVIFAFVAISWTMRTNLYNSNLPNLPFWATIPQWFIYVWVRHREQSSTDQETQPLLSERASQSEE